MLKKLVGLTMAVIMVMALIAVPAMAEDEVAGFSSANVVYTDIGGIQQKADSNFEVTTEQYSTNRYTYLEAKRKTGQALSSDKKLVRLNSDYGPGAGDYDGTVNYAHSRFYVAVNQGSSSEAGLRIQLNYDTGSNDGRVENVASVELNVNSFYMHACNNDQNSDTGTYFGIYEPAGEGPFQVRHNTGDIPWNQIDLIVDVDGGKSGMVYAFINGKLYGYTQVAASKLDANSKKIYHGYTVTARSGQWSKSGDVFYFKSNMNAEGQPVRSTIYANTDDYTVSLEDVMNHQGLTADLSEETNPNIIMKTTDLQTYMPGRNDWGFTKYGVMNNTQSDLVNTHNQNVSYSDGAATIALNTSEQTEAASMLRGGYPLNNNMGIGYSNYKNVAKFIRLSFDQQIEKGTVEYGVVNPGYTKGVSFFNNGGNLVVSAQGQSDFGYDNTILSDVAYNEKAHIDWVYDTVEKVQYIYVNEKFVSKGTIGKSRIGDIRIMTTGDTSVTIDNWSMTLYNNNQTYDDLYVEITGEVPSTEPTFEWNEDCYVDYVDGDFAPVVSATATNYDGTAKIYFAVYAADGSLLDCTIKDFESDVFYGDEVEVVFSEGNYDKAVDKVSVFIFETGTIRPLITNKTILKSEFVTE